jgi:predicted ATPase
VASVPNAERFRQAVLERRRAAGRTQQQLARAIGLHPDVLSHKLHQHGARLTAAEVTAIVKTLAGWGAVASRAEVRTLLALMAVPPHAIPEQAWGAPPLGTLPPDPGPPPDAALSPSPGVLPEGQQPVLADHVPAGPGASVPAADAGRAAEPDAGQAGHTDARSAAEKGTRPASSRLTPIPLPVPLTPLVGRAAEVAAVAAAVSASRLITLTGTGGTGKTRVALRVAAELAATFPDGAAFADLAPLSDPDLVAVTLLRALGVTPHSAAHAEDQLAGALAPAALLLVVDNMEHLVEQAPLLDRLLAAAPRMHLLVTSRIPLALYGEHQVRVPPLGVPAGRDAADDPAASEAVQLFIQRARAVVSGFAPVGEELAATAAICAALDGLPLAIELAAARVRLYPPQALLTLLRDRLSLLTGGPRNLPQRQQTIRAALDWSDALLPGPAQELFACLGVFAGPFDADAAAAVRGVPDSPNGASEPQPMLDQLAALADHSLLEVIPGLTPRFTQLAIVREYAQARLAESGQADQVHDRHLRYYLALASQARVGVHGPMPAAWVDRLEAAFADIRGALDWARARGQADGSCLADGLRLATAVGPVWRRRGSLAEGALHLERLLALDPRPGSVTQAVRAQALLEASAMACFRGDCPDTTALAGDGLRLCEELGDLAGMAWAHRYLGEAALTAGDLPAARPHFELQHDLARQAGDIWIQASAANMLAQVSRYQHRYDQATRELRQALDGFRAADDPDGAATVLNSLGEVARDAGRPDQARALFQDALRGHRQVRNNRGIAADLEGLATTAAHQGEARAALVCLGAAQALRQANGGPLLPPEQAIIDRLLAASLDSLPPPEREQALTDGSTFPLDQIIAAALDASPPPPVARRASQN